MYFIYRIPPLFSLHGVLEFLQLLTYVVPLQAPLFSDTLSLNDFPTFSSIINLTLMPKYSFSMNFYWDYVYAILCHSDSYQNVNSWAIWFTKNHLLNIHHLSESVFIFLNFILVSSCNSGVKYLPAMIKALGLVYSNSK